MQAIWGNVAALAVALIFYTYREITAFQARKKRVLCERVAYMLWVAADATTESANEMVTADAV